MNKEKLLSYSFNNYINLLTYDEIEALQNYTNMFYRTLNKMLREQNIGNCLIFKNIISNIDTAIEKFKYDEEIVVWRDLSFHLIADLYDYIKDLQKRIFIERGYASTSLEEGRYYCNYDIRLKIYIPAFYNGACIKYISTVSKEEEYLLARESKLDIEDITCINKDNRPKYLVKARAIK